MKCQVVLLHGFLGDARDFAGVTAASAAASWIALDLPGHGARPEPPGATFDDGVALLEQRIAARGLARCHLVGYSMGGRLALALLARFPALVASAVAIGASAGIEDAAARARRRMRDEAVAARLEASEQPAAFEAFLRGWYAQEMFASLRASAAFPAMLERRLEGRPRMLAAALRALGPGAQPPLHEALREAPAPILLIAGEADAKYARGHAELAARLPTAACATVAGAGHGVHLEKPAELAAVLQRFLSRN